MTKKFNEGDTVYFISNGIFVREAKVVSEICWWICNN